MSKSPNACIGRTNTTDVKWGDGFWGPRFDQVGTVRIPDMEQVLQDQNNGAHWPNFLAVTGDQPGSPFGAAWGDGDCYKFVETMAHVYEMTKDPALDAKMDEYIDVIARAQMEDGYIHTRNQLLSRPWWLERWTRKRDHELYNMGHFFTAACVHHRATGKDNFLKPAIKLADYVYRVFAGRPAYLAHYGWNPSQMMGLVDMYRTTGDARYLELAEIFVEMRGSAPVEQSGLDEGDQNQDRKKLKDETEAVGHAVTGPYLYCGAADVAAEKDREDYVAALKRIWHSMAHRRMYITGGCCAIHKGVSTRDDKVHEAFGFDWQLPNTTAYNETCANISAAMFARRMLDLTGEAEYADVVERILYNVFLASTSLDGVKYFYTNALLRHKEQSILMNDSTNRWRVFQCYCCPPSVSRTMAKVHQWACGVSENALWVHLYDACTIDTELPGAGRIVVDEQTKYPWDETVTFTIKEAPSSATSLKLRIPAWAKGATATMNGETVADVTPGDYLDINRTWQAGDVVELTFPMPVRLMRANPHVEEDHGKVCVMRGPLTYCVESPDLPSGMSIFEVALKRGTSFKLGKNDELGVITIEADGVHLPVPNNDDALYEEYDPAGEGDLKLTLIPYYAWNNREQDGEMAVWLPLA